MAERADTTEAIRPVELVTAGTLMTADGRAVHAGSEYAATVVATSDGRAVRAVSTAAAVAAEGGPVKALSLYPAGTLMTADGRPVEAVAFFSGAGAASPSFDPASLFTATNGGWYDPSSLTSLSVNTDGTGGIPAVGAGVGRITDKSGNGNHLSAVGTKPILRNSGSRYWLDFRAGGGYMKSAGSAWVLPQPCAQWLAIVTPTAAGQTLLTDGSGQRQAVAINGNIMQMYANGAVANSNLTVTGEASSVLGAIFNGASSVARRNGANGTLDANPGSSSLDQIFLGASGGGTANWLGDFYGGVWLARAPTAGEQANLDTYMGAKMGLTL